MNDGSATACLFCGTPSDIEPEHLVRSSASRKAAEFRPRDDWEWNGYGWRPLDVRWYDPV
jgi:hypothetical protein